MSFGKKIKNWRDFMRRKIIYLLVLMLVFISVLGFTSSNSTNVQAAPYYQNYSFVTGVVTADSLNIRQGASTNYPVVCVLNKGQQVRIFGKLGEWYAVYDVAKGCVGAANSHYIKVYWPKAPSKGPTATLPPVAKATAKPIPTIAPAPGQAVPPTGISQDEQTLLNLVNKARASAGVGALKFDMNLVKTARLKAKDMVDNNYFSHQSPTYGSPFDMMRQFGISFKTAGENIAGNQTVEAAFNAWMNSTGHRENILNGSYNYTGIGIVSSPSYGKILVQQFIGK
jgi:uncharacterized YkwD family protein